MKNLILIIFTFFITNLIGQINVNIKVNNNLKRIYVVFEPVGDYSNPTTNVWGSSNITLRYNASNPIGWYGFVPNSNYNFFEKTSTIPDLDGNDGFFYKSFHSNYMTVAGGMTRPDTVFSISMTNINQEFDLELLQYSRWAGARGLNDTIQYGTPFTNIVGIEPDMSNNWVDDLRPSIKSIEYNNGNAINTSDIPIKLTFSEPVKGVRSNFIHIDNGAKVISLDSISPSVYIANVKLACEGSYNITFAGKSVYDYYANPFKHNTKTNSFKYDRVEQATYLLEALESGYYKVSLISHMDYSGTNAITSTAQVTLNVKTGIDFDHTFYVSNLTSLIPGVYWAENSRYSDPAENPGRDYISFGLISNGTSSITYKECDTIPLFTFKNRGICSEDSIYLMPILGDPFQWPNSLNANVGQQLSVSGYNQPDVPLAVSGIVSCMAEVSFHFKAKLQGPFDPTYNLMKDDLRAKGFIPLVEPYENYIPLFGQPFDPFQHVDGGNEYLDENILFIEGNDAIVDWVFVELRNQHDSSQVLSTRSALVQRDGDIVDTDGYSDLLFKKLKSDNYFFSVRHRNHLGLMSATKIPVLTNRVVNDESSYLYIHSNPYDFTDLNNEMYGQYAGYIKDSVRLMWAGNSNADNYVMFQGGGVGEGLDIDNVYHNIITDWRNDNYSYNHVAVGYYPADNNLDGFVKYQGPANDVDPFIFFNIISRHPGNIDKFVNFYITEQLPR